jgi:hypothetical protein
MGNNIQFYYANLFKDAVVTVSSGSNTDNLLDGNTRTFWMSEGSDDSTTETIELEVTYEVPFDTIFLIGTNIKAGEAFYWNGSAYVSIAAWSSHLESRKIDLASEQTQLKIKIEGTTTDIANTEKRIAQIIVTKLEYELDVNPARVTPTRKIPIDVVQNISGQITKYIKGNNTSQFNLEFKSLGAVGSVDDADFIDSWIEDQTNKLVCFCGDTAGTRRPYRYNDVVEVTPIDSSSDNEFTGGFSATGDNRTITLSEVQQ